MQHQLVCANPDCNRPCGKAASRNGIPLWVEFYAYNGEPTGGRISLGKNFKDWPIHWHCEHCQWDLALGAPPWRRRIPVRARPPTNQPPAMT